MTLGERIKKVRKALDLTQQEFADRIGMKRNSIAQVEMGRNTSEQTITSICREFNISEEWLRTGSGEMFIPSPEESVDELIRVHDLDELDRQIILEFIKLTAEERDVVKKYVRNMVKHVSAAPPQDSEAAKQAEWEREADAFAEIARQQFLSEKLQESQASSAKKSGGAGGVA